MVLVEVFPANLSGCSVALQFCVAVNGAQGRIYRPKGARRLILYLKDINLPKPDKYNTSQIIAFLQQVVMHKGFYDEDLEFAHLEHVQIVASMAPSSTLGRHHVSTRFTANVRICSVFYPESNELVDIAQAMLKVVLTEGAGFVEEVMDYRV